MIGRNPFERKIARSYSEIKTISEDSCTYELTGQSLEWRTVEGNNLVLTNL